MLALLAAPALLAAQDHHHGDEAFGAMQKRGAIYMGVDQYTSTHEFTDLPDGGRITLARDAADTAGVSTIRAHLKQITQAFRDGDFDIPMLVHDEHVPGTDVMSRRHDRITYEFREVPGGGQIRIQTSDAMARTAVHAFLAFQRDEHRTAHTH
jgi:hypothetical protein